MEVIKGYLTKVKFNGETVYTHLSKDRNESSNIGIQFSGNEGATYSVTPGVFIPGLKEYTYAETN